MTRTTTKYNPWYVKQRRSTYVVWSLVLLIELTKYLVIIFRFLPQQQQRNNVGWRRLGQRLSYGMFLNLVYLLLSFLLTNYSVIVFRFLPLAPLRLIQRRNNMWQRQRTTRCMRRQRRWSTYVVWYLVLLIELTKYSVISIFRFLPPLQRQRNDVGWRRLRWRLSYGDEHSSSLCTYFRIFRIFVAYCSRHAYVTREAVTLSSSRRHHCTCGSVVLHPLTAARFPILVLLFVTHFSRHTPVTREAISTLA
jgi:hypothetical protein